jgi:tRNA threonylcarbamoyladenosine biosynthesis protein TsaE
MRLKFFTTSPSQTKRAGEVLAQEILKTSPAKKAHVIGLLGDLGGGKTTFVQGLARGLRVKEKILSPTFILMRKFPAPKRRNFYHFDCYRIQKAKELLALGFQGIIAEPKNIVAVEWADKVRQIMPPNTVWVSFEFAGKRKRKIMVK